MSATAESIFGRPSATQCPAEPRIGLKQQRRRLTLLLILTDGPAVTLAFGIAYWLRFEVGVTTSPDVVPETDFYPSLAMLLVPLFLIVFALGRLYEVRTLLGGVGEWARVFQACTYAAMLVILATFAGHNFVVSRSWLLLACAFSFVLVSMSRFGCRRFVYALREHGYLLVPSVLVGTNEEAASLAEDLRDWRASGLRLMGFVGGDGNGCAPDVSLPLLGPAREIRRIIAEYGVEDLIVAITALSREELLRLCEEVNSLPGVHMRLSSGLYELLTTHVSATAVGAVPLISLSKVRLEPRQLYAKTFLEYVFVIIGLLALWPVLLTIAILVKLDSPGPVIHRRRVLGVSGNQFDAFKFRTMHIDGDQILSRSPELVEELRTNHKLKKDPRVTNAGRWLRKYSLDELPQLFNVLLGQMGLVGPRMITAAEAEKYGRQKMNLLTVKPGITGLWQVNGRSDVSYAERVKMDMYYIRNYSVWLDLQILFMQTLPAVLARRGAY